MNKMGNIKDTYKKFKEVLKQIKSSYIYRLVSKVFSFLCTLVLIFLLVIGGLMFYFNLKGKAYAEKGENYTAPFGLYTIISGSMEPHIHVYDVVIVTKTKDLSTIKVGDVITFISSWDLNYGDTVTHRVVAISKNESGEYQFTTKGDANQSQDGAMVTQNNLVGKVIMRIPQLGRVQFFLATKVGWFIAIFIPAMMIIIFDCIKIFKLVVLKNKLENVTDSKDIDKIYFDGDRLDGRELGDEELSKTSRLRKIVKKDISSAPALEETEDDEKITIDDTVDVSWDNTYEEEIIGDDIENDIELDIKLKDNLKSRVPKLNIKNAPIKRPIRRTPLKHKNRK